MLHSYQQFIKTSLKSLLRSKVRSFLTMLGIIIGVGSVILINSVGAGAQSLIVNEVKTIGTDLIGILPGKTEDGTPAAAMGIVITTLTYEDAVALKQEKNVPNVIKVAAYSNGVSNMTWR